MSELDDIKKQYEEMLDASRDRRENFTTSSGIPLEPLYWPEPLNEKEYAERTGIPGKKPYTRGIHPGMYRQRLWTMRQYSGFGSAEETNLRFRNLLEAGQTGLSVAFDLPTQIGYDSDHELSRGEVGRVGVAIDTLEDMERLFQNIPLDQVSVSMTINSTAPILLALIVCLAEKQGISADKLRGTVQNDILKEYIARGTYIYPVKPSLRLVVDIMKYCRDNIPKWNSISISGYHIREAGSTAAQELGFTFANAICYLEEARNQGLNLERIGRNISFFFNAHNNFFEETAKFRAARRIWTRIMSERFGIKDEKACRLRFHTQTAGSSLSAVEPDNNVVRVALQALAAVLGGTQSLHTNSKDEALALPTQESATLALRTQQIIAYESGAADVVDPLGGSYLVEKLTGQVEKAAWEYIQEVDKMGGAVKAVQKKWFQSEIEQSAHQYQKGLESKENVVVGVNKFRIQEQTGIDDYKTLTLDPQVQENQIARLKKYRSQRNQKETKAALDKLQKTATQESAHLMPDIVDCIKAKATLGEISDALRKVFGTYEAN